MRKPSRHIIFPFLAFSFLLLTISAEAQQLKLGNNPTVIDPSAVLQLESPNQGLLLTRVSDTAAINAFSPPDGMIIYFTDGATLAPYGPNAGVYERKDGGWKRLIYVGDGSIGIVSLNGSVVPAQTFATGISGTGFNISTNVATGVHTFNIPIASTADTGLVNIGAQTFGGAKTFANTLTLGQSLITNGSFGNDGQVLRSRGVINISPTWENLLLDSLYNVKISSPSNGQVLQYNGTNWVNVSGTGNFWSLTGNSISTGQFLGTTNNQPLSFVVNNQPVGTLTSNNVAFGPGAVVLGQKSTAIGDTAIVAGNNSAAMGYKAQVMSTANNSVAIGYGAIVSANNSVAIGYNTIANNINTIILGNGANVGINTSSPTNTLTVNSGTSGSSGLQFTQMNSTSPPTVDSALLGIDKSGNVVVARGSSIPSVVARTIGQSFQISATRNAMVNYSITLTASSGLFSAGGGSSEADLWISPANTGTPPSAPWTKVATINLSLNGTLGISQTQTAILSGFVPKRYYIIINSVISGSGSVTYVTGQEMTLP